MEKIKTENPLTPVVLDRRERAPQYNAIQYNKIQYNTIQYINPPPSLRLVPCVLTFLDIIVLIRSPVGMIENFKAWWLVLLLVRQKSGSRSGSAFLRIRI